MPRIVIGSRGSKLALLQSDLVAQKLKSGYPDADIEVKVIHTHGDKILDVALSKIGDKGLFTKELEQALLDADIDLAVHSLKDVPTVLPPGLVLGAILEREMAVDVLVAPSGKKLADLPPGAVIGTSSLRRRAQLLALRSDFKVVDLRGNLETRVRKMEELKLDGIILAWAGLMRMGMQDLITEILEPDVMLPAAGQGALAIEIRDGDSFIRQLVSTLDSPAARVEVAAERAFLGGLGGGCQVPIGALAQVNGDQIRLDGLVAALDGDRIIRVSGEASWAEATVLGDNLARQAVDQGGQAILDAIERG